MTISLASLCGIVCFVVCVFTAQRGTGARPDHGIYIGMVELRLPDTGNLAALRVKVFHDDLQSAVRAAFPSRFRPAERGGEWLEANREAVLSYFRRTLVFRARNTLLKYNFAAFTRENDLYILDFVLQCPDKWQSLQIRADFLTELFPAQSNVIRWEAGKSGVFFARASRNSPEVRIERD